MPYSNLKRFGKPGDICFVTMVTNKRTPIFANENNIKMLLRTFTEVQCIKKCDIFSYVVLPDHMHLILRSYKYQTGQILHSLKRNFTLNWKKINQGSIYIDQKNLWQERFWEHVINYDREFINHLNYIFNNPVKHGYVESPNDWPYSSFNQYNAKNDTDLQLSETGF